jgi:hypothetical protein
LNTSAGATPAPWEFALPGELPRTEDAVVVVGVGGVRSPWEFALQGELPTDDAVVGVVGGV